MKIVEYGITEEIMHGRCGKDLKIMGNIWKSFWKDEEGIGVVEIILILVVLIALIVIFREQITSIVSKAFGEINGGANKINSTIKIK